MSSGICDFSKNIEITVLRVDRHEEAQENDEKNDKIGKIKFCRFQNQIPTTNSKFSLTVRDYALSRVPDKSVGVKLTTDVLKWMPDHCMGPVDPGT